MIVPIERFNIIKNIYSRVVADIIDNIAIIHFNGFCEIRSNEIFNSRSSSLWVNGKLVGSHKIKTMQDFCEEHYKGEEDE